MTLSHAISPLTDEQILANLAPMFVGQYREIKRTHLQSGESAYAAANCAISSSFGFALVTSHRLLLVMFYDQRSFDFLTYGHRPHVRYKQHKGGSDRYWVLPSSVDLTNGELKNKRTLEISLRSLGAVNREDLTIRSDEGPLELLQLDLRDATDHLIQSTYYGLDFVRNDGEIIYELLQSAIRNGGKLAPEQSGVGESVAYLERLAALHRSGALTDQEFRAAKTRLLGL